MKKSKLANIIIISINILFCLISFLFVFSNDSTSLRATFTNTLLVSLASLISILVMEILSKKRLIMIPMIVLLLNAFFTFNTTYNVSLLTTSGISSGMDALDFAIIALSILGIVFTCLKHKWGAVVGIVGIAFLIYSSNEIIITLNIAKENLFSYDMLAWLSSSTLLQFVWLIVPMICLLCEKNAQGEKQEEKAEENN